MLARAGSSVWELAAAGKPAVLVPYPFATARPPGEERALTSCGAAARSSVPRDASSGACRSSCARCSTIRDRLERDGARRCSRPRGRRPRDEIAEELIALAAA